MSTLASSSPTVEVEDLQGLIARSYAALQHALYVPLAFDPQNPAGARAWVGELAVLVTSAEKRSAQVTEEGEARNLAFTCAGLQTLGLAEDALESFSREFQEGMATEHRKRALGDTEEADPKDWRWGGPNNPTIHAMLFLYAGSAELLAEMLAEEQERAARHGATLAESLDSIMLADDKEHFGFHDGIAQPRITGLGGGEDIGTAHPIPAGEVVLGYPNAYGKLPDSPTVAETPRASEILPPRPFDPDDPNAPSRRDLGRNGSYIVFRQLEQDVRAFWRWVDQRTRAGNGADPERRKWLAAKMVGRWPNGAPLVRYPDREPETFDREKANDFMYKSDLKGEKCPIGSHIRRSNPRDGMQPAPKESLLVADRHRLLRRGRAYGEPAAATFDPDDILSQPETANGERGLHFVCFNTDIVRQFEFVQHTWVNNMKFDGLYADPDPVIAPHCDPANAKHPELISNFTVQHSPVRHRERAIPRFVTMRGGAYLFMPGMRALRYLASLD